MSHTNFVQQFRGSPGSGADTGNSPATKGDLLGISNALENTLLNLPDPFAHRKITSADIVNLTADKILSGTITVAIGVGGSNIIIDGSVPDIVINDGTRDRIILGKIGSDYTIKIVDAAGNVMWDPTTGVTSAGITNASITATDIANATITATQIANLTITGAQISNLTITDSKINDVAIDKLTTGNLTVVGTLSGSGTVQSASSGARVTIDVNDFKAYDSSNNNVFDINYGGGSSQMKIVRTDGLDSILADSYSSTAGDGARLVFRRARGSVSSPVAPQIGDSIMELLGAGWTGTQFLAQAGVKILSEDNWDASNMGTEIMLSTTTRATTTARDRWAVRHNGLLEGQLSSDGNASVISLQDKSAGTTPSAGTDCKVYCRNNKIIFVYNDSGTTRYKYLDLTGTGVTWVHTTSAP